MSAEYQKAIDKNNAAIRRYHDVLADYRAGKLTDAEFLKAQGIYKKACEEFDGAFLKEQMRGAAETKTKKFFYCSIIDGNKKGLLAGPYDTHQKALDALPEAQRRAQATNPTQSAFAAFGTAGSDTEHKTIFGVI